MEGTTIGHTTLLSHFAKPAPAHLLVSGVTNAG